MVRDLLSCFPWDLQGTWAIEYFSPLKSSERSLYSPKRDRASSQTVRFERS